MTDDKDKKDVHSANNPGADDRNKWGRENERDNPAKGTSWREDSPKDAYASLAKTEPGGQSKSASQSPAPVKGAPGGQGQRHDPSERSGTGSPSGSGVSPGGSGAQGGTSKPRDGKGKPQQDNKGDQRSSDKGGAPGCDSTSKSDDRGCGGSGETGASRSKAGSSAPTGQKPRGDAKPGSRVTSDEGNTGVSGETDEQDMARS